jgi:hypothetical protein
MSSPLLQPTTGDRSEHRDRFPLGKLDHRATVSPISGVDRRSNASLHISPVQLTPHLPLHFTSLQVNAEDFPALRCRNAVVPAAPRHSTDDRPPR